jgi:hypothetical protein
MCLPFGHVAGLPVEETLGSALPLACIYAYAFRSLARRRRSCSPRRLKPRRGRGGEKMRES